MAVSELEDGKSVEEVRLLEEVFSAFFPALDELFKMLKAVCEPNCARFCVIAHATLLSSAGFATIQGYMEFKAVMAELAELVAEVFGASPGSIHELRQLATQALEQRQEREASSSPAAAGGAGGRG